MAEYPITLSLLIAAVLIIRGIFRKTVSPRVIYALWLVVVLRLCLPFSLFTIEMPFPMPTLTAPAEQTEQAEQVEPILPPADTAATMPDTFTPTVTAPSTAPPLPPVTSPAPVSPAVTAEPSATISPTPTRPLSADTAEPPAVEEEPTPPAQPFDWAGVVRNIRLIGTTVLAAWFAVTGIRFHRQLHRDRRLVRRLRRTKVYLSAGAGAPCLAGLIPSIYITPDAAESDAGNLIVLHEFTHLRHGDHIWNAVRVLALIVHWWNPLVWAAAFLSKQDAELACDDALAASMDDRKRLEYAHILLDTLPQKHRYAVGLGSAPIKERILMLTKKPKNRLLCVILAVFLIIGAAGCSFIGLRDPNQEDTQSPAQETQTPGGETTQAPVQNPEEILLILKGELLVRKEEYDALMSRFKDQQIYQYATPSYSMTVYMSGDDPAIHVRDGETGRYREYHLRLSDAYSDVKIIHFYTDKFAEEFHLLLQAKRDEKTVYWECTVPLDLMPEDTRTSVPLPASTVTADTAERLQDIQTAPLTPVTELEALPDKASLAAFRLSPAGGYPVYCIDEGDMQFYRYDARSRKTSRCELSLPDGLTDGRIICAEGGMDGTGIWTITVTVEARKDEEKVYLNYIFPEGEDVGELTPRYVVFLQDYHRKGLEKKLNSHSVSIYRCDDVYRTADTPTHGQATLTIPTAFTDYKVTDCQVMLCEDGCQPDKVVMLASQGYAPVYRLVHSDTFTAGNYSVRKYATHISDQMQEDLRAQGVLEAALARNARIHDYLIELGNNLYAYISITAKTEGPKPADEDAVVDEIIRGTTIRLATKEQAEAFVGTGPFVGYIADAEAEWIEVYTRANGDYVTRIPWAVIEDFPATDRTDPNFHFGWMTTANGWGANKIYAGKIGDFCWAMVCTGPALGSGRHNLCTSQDGGLTWQIAEESALPNGTATGGVFFTDKIGYISFRTDEAGKVPVFRTDDSGKTWVQEEIYLPEELIDQHLEPLAPVAENGQWIIPVKRYLEGGQYNPFRLISTDGGRSWLWDQQASSAMLPRPDAPGVHLIPLAVYGGEYGTITQIPDASGTGSRTIVHAYHTGSRYLTFGVANATGEVIGYKTYLVTDKDGKITGITETETFTRALILQKGTPYTGTPNGLFACTAYSQSSPTLFTRRLQINWNEITLTSTPVGTDMTTTYTGRMDYDPETGLLSAELSFSSPTPGGAAEEPMTVKGRLYSYGGLVHFLCEESEIGSLQPGDPLPLTFLLPQEGQEAFPYPVKLDDTYDGGWEVPLSPQPASDKYRIDLSVDAADIQFWLRDHEENVLALYRGNYDCNTLSNVITATLNNCLTSDSEPITMRFTLALSDAEDVLQMQILDWTGGDLPSPAGQTLALTRTLDTKIIALYHAATEAASWFRVASLTAGESAIDQQDHFTDSGMEYFRILRFANLAEFRSYLETMFSPAVVDSFFTDSSVAFYQERDGKLYGTMGMRGTDVTKGKEAYTVAQVSDTEYELQVIVEVLEHTANTLGVKHMVYLFPYELVDGKWVFTDFPGIR